MTHGLDTIGLILFGLVLGELINAFWRWRASVANRKRLSPAIPPVKVQQCWIFLVRVRRKRL